MALDLAPDVAAARPPTTEPVPAPSIASGPPLGILEPRCDVGRLDGLLTRAAATAPRRIALQNEDDVLTFGAWDAQVTAAAAALQQRAAPGAVVAIASDLTPAFGVSVFAISRAGLVGALVNPLLPDERLLHLLRAVGAEVALVPAAVARRLAAARDTVPALREIVLTAPDDELGLPVLAEFAAAAPAWSAPSVRPDAVAFLQFTSGTTGVPKIVQLTHRNMVVNAEQTVHAHRLDERSVLFNALPTCHVMHLDIGVAAAATHVLWRGRDIAEAVEDAAAAGATHFYTLPVRFAQLAASPALPGLRAPGLTAMLSGGSALAAHVADRLEDHFCIPVVQGYGLAETAPSVFLGDLDEPRHGSCGRLVPGAECRIVDLDTRAVLPLGGNGEIEVRGPQLMSGYRGHAPHEDVDADGWFSTGDVGHLDADGFLWVVDRLKDVFKVDDNLVAPSEIETVLLAHPDVRDCVVVDAPDPVHGAVAWGLVVAEGPTPDPDGVAAWVNERTPYYEHLHAVQLVDQIPRSPVGKIARRELREQALQRSTTAAVPAAT